MAWFLLNIGPVSGSQKVCGTSATSYFSIITFLNQKQSGLLSSRAVIEERIDFLSSDRQGGLFAANNWYFFIIFAFSANIITKE